MKWLILSVSLFAAALVVFYFSSLRINTTRSIPTGVYKLLNDKPNKYDYSWFCPPNNPSVKTAFKRGYFKVGDCLGGYSHFMKLVAGVEGDQVTINESGVYVNNALLSFSKPLKTDGANRPLFLNILNNYTLKKGEYLMMTDGLSSSFDARYFGVVTGDIFKLTRVLTWK